MQFSQMYKSGMYRSAVRQSERDYEQIDDSCEKSYQKVLSGKKAWQLKSLQIFH